jgi:hypothetical protein
MNRLRDEVGLDPVSERGIRMLRELLPPPRPAELKWRVWGALQQSPDRASPARRFGMLKALALGAGIVAFTATAVAAIGGHWIGRLVGPAHPALSPASPAAAERPRVVRRVAEAAPAIVETTPLEPVAPAPAARLPDRVRARVVPSPARERTQVLDALIALRRDHDPARASVLLDRYLDGNRHGDLREEALVLAIEAADARGDVARAGRLARAYQAEFPRGLFIGYAQSHLGD